MGLWFCGPDRSELQLHSAWLRRVGLHFGAIDWEAMDRGCTLVLLTTMPSASNLS